MLLTGTTTETYSNSCCDLVSWELLKSHLRRNDDTDRDLIMTYLCAAVSYCEQYTNRALAFKAVKMYYQYERDCNVYDLQVRFPFDTADDTITVTVTDDAGDTSTITAFDMIGKDIIRIKYTELPDTWSMIVVEYTPEIYTQRDAVIPAILMKVGEMDCNREDGPIPKVSSIISILNRHRIKRHF
jgi:hypothetical protein